MKCYAVRPEKRELEFIVIDNTLEALQEFVGGYIEVVPTMFENIVVICDEEGRLKGKPYCCTIGGIPFVGPVLLAGVKDEEFADFPLTIVEYIACLIKNLRADAAAYKAEKDAFQKRQKQAENHVEGLLRYLQGALNGEKFVSDRCAVTFRKTTRVELNPDVSVYEIDQRFLRYKTPELDKTLLAKVLKEGVEVAGVHLEEGLSMTVK